MLQWRWICSWLFIGLVYMWLQLPFSFTWQSLKDKFKEVGKDTFWWNIQCTVMFKTLHFLNVCTWICSLVSFFLVMFKWPPLNIWYCISNIHCVYIKTTPLIFLHNTQIYKSIWIKIQTIQQRECWIKFFLNPLLVFKVLRLSLKLG